MEIHVKIQSDRKGYFDRECPNKKCLYNFKINIDGWKEKVYVGEVDALTLLTVVKKSA